MELHFLYSLDIATQDFSFSWTSPSLPNKGLDGTAMPVAMAGVSEEQPPSSLSMWEVPMPLYRYGTLSLYCTKQVATWTNALSAKSANSLFKLPFCHSIRSLILLACERSEPKLSRYSENHVSVITN